MKYYMSVLLLSVLSTGSVFGDIFYWKNNSSSYYSFGAQDKWLAGTSASAPAAERCPGEDDWLHYTVGKITYQYFDLDAKSYAVRGIDYTDPVLEYGYRYMGFRNGGLTFTEDVYTRRLHGTVENGGVLTFAGTCNTRFGWSGAENKITVKNGGILNAYGTLSIGSLRVVNEAGGKVDFDPEKLILWEEASSGVYSSFENSGEMVFPHGLDFTESDKRKASHANETRFVQHSGTMTFDGPIDVSKVNYGTFTFNLAGGRLVINDDVSMSRFETVGMAAAGSSATIEIAEGKTLDWSNAKFAENTTLDITGGGTIVLGLERPTVLNVSEDSSVDEAAIFIGAGLVVDSMQNWETKEFTVQVDFENCPPSPIFTSANRGILEKYYNALEVPQGWVLAVEGDSVVVKSRPPMDFAWQGAEKQEKYTNPRMWSIGRTEGLFYNPYGVLPSAKDSIYYGIGAVHRKFLFDMDGEELTVGGFADGFANYYQHDMSVSNGTLVFAESFSNAYIAADILAGGRLVLGGSSHSLLGLSGAFTRLNVAAGGKLDITGGIEMHGLVLNNREGGETVFEPSSVSVNADNTEAEGRKGRGVFNEGILIATAGLDLGVSGGVPTDLFRANPPVFTLKHLAGTMKLGGVFRASAADGAAPRFRVDIEGGAVEVLEDVMFDSSLDEAMIGEESETSWKISAGKTLDLSNVHIGRESRMAVECAEASRMVFGGSLPSALDISGSPAIRFNGLSLRLDSVSGYETATFEVDENALEDGVNVVASCDDGFLSRVCETLELPEGWSVEVRGGGVRLSRLAAPDRPVFSFGGEKRLSAAEAWSGPQLADGASVYVSGGDTVAVLGADAPPLSKITVKRGATLKIAENLSSFPELALEFDGKILVAPGVDITLPKISSRAMYSQIPVVEVATGATVRVGSDYEFKNVHLDLFGNFIHATNVWFGTAEAGETTYFGMRAIGAKFNDIDKCNGTNSIVCAKARGGRVVSPAGVYFKHVQYLPAYSGRVSHNVGCLNPVDEAFTMTIDDCYLDMRGNRWMDFAGAATVKCVNGGGIFKHDSWASWGLYGKIRFSENARLLLDGSSCFYFVYNREASVHFEPRQAGVRQLVMKDGSWFAAHTPNGRNLAAVMVENSYCDIMQLQYHSYKDGDDVVHNDPRRDWYWDAFHNFTEIYVPEGKFFGMRAASNYIHGAEWKRESAIAPPVTGGGDLIVTNALPGLTLNAIVKRADNTATGRAYVCADTPGSRLTFADGSNWAGTLVADENIAFTNLVDNSAPASVALGALELAGSLPIRVWGDAESLTNDFLSVENGVVSVGKGRVAPLCMNGFRPQFGDSFAFARVPADAEPVAVSRGWKIVETMNEDGYKTLSARWEPNGLVILVK